jgi:Condensation domain
MIKTAKISKRAGPGPVPLSAGQAMMWILNKLDPDDLSTRRPLSLRLIGDLSLPAVERSLTEIVRRHEILRSVFPEMEGQPVQMALPPTRVTVKITDLQSVDADRREIQARELAIEETRKEFDLANGPVFRAILMRLEPADHVLLILMHHIVFDGWSEKIFLDELGTFYQAFSSGTSHAVPEPAVQYADFALWQHERSSDDELDRQMAYWRRQLQREVCS